MSKKSRKIQKKALKATTDSSISALSTSSALTSHLGGEAAAIKMVRIKITNKVGIKANPYYTGPTGVTHASAARATRIKINKKSQRLPHGPLILKTE